MFDVQAAKALTLEGLGPNVASSGPGQVSIYTKSGTHQGFENNSPAWTLIAVRTLQNVAQSYFFFDEPIEMGAGSTQSFYVRDFNDTASVGDIFFANGDLTMKWGPRNDSLFGSFVGPAALWTLFLYKKKNCHGS